MTDDDRIAMLRSRLAKAGVEEQDLAVAAGQLPVAEALINEIFEALLPLSMGGLAFVGAQIPERVMQLASRAESHGWATGVDLLLALVRGLEALRERGDPADIEAVSVVWQQLQRAVLWLRMMKVEYGFLSVEAALLGIPEAEAAVVREERVEVEVLPVGVEARGSGEVIWWGWTANGPPRAVALLDRFGEVDRTDPVHRPIISRLFQAEVVVNEVLTAKIRVQDVPEAGKGDALVFRPSFRAAPRRSAWTAFPTTLGAIPDINAAWRSKHAVVHWTGSGLSVRQATGEPLACRRTATTQFNLTKLLIRQAEVSVPIGLVLRGRGGGAVPIRAFTGFDGGVLLEADPTLFRLDPVVLSRRLARSAETLDAVNAFVTQSASALVNGVSPDERGVLEGLVAGLSSVSIQQRYFIDHARRWGGLEVETDDGLVDVIRTTLLSAEDDLEIYAALALAGRAGVVGELSDALGSLQGRRYAGSVRAPDPVSVCARTRLALFRSSEADRLDAKAFFDAHRSTWTGTGRRAMPLPSPWEMLMVCETLAAVEGLPLDSPIADRVGWSLARTRQWAADSLARWVFADETELDASALAGPILAGIRALGMLPWFVVPR